MRTTVDKAQKRLIKPYTAGDPILRALIQSSPLAIIAIDLDRKIILWNPAAERIFGWKEEEVLGKPNPIIPEDRQEEFKRFTARAEKGDFISDVGVKRLRKDGSLIDVSISTASIRSPEGKVMGIIALLSDITGRKRMEEALLEEKNRTEAIIAAMGDGISIQDTNFKILYENQVQKDIIGEHIGQYCYMAYERREDTCEGCPVAKVFKDGKIHRAERNAPTDKGMVTVEITASPLKDASGKIIAGIEVIRDITGRKKAEEALFEAKHDWEDTFNIISDMITVHDKDFNIIRANKAAEKILGLSFLEGKSCEKCSMYYHGTEKPPEGCPSCQVLKTSAATTSEIFEPHLGMFIEIRAIPRFDINNNLIGLIHVVRDITERKKTEEEISRLLLNMTRAKMEWEATFDSVGELIMLIDKDFNLIRCNKSFAGFAGVTPQEAIGKKCYALFPCNHEQSGHIMERIAKGEPVLNAEIRTETGQWFYLSHQPVIDEKGEFLYSVIIATDITAIKTTEQKLLDSEVKLKKKVDDLQRFYDMAVGRELKMKELKKEITRLNTELLKRNGN